MKNKKIGIGIAALTALVVSTGFISGVAAYHGDPEAQGPNYSPERHDAMVASIDSGDYDAWVEARGEKGNGRIMDVVNEDNFSRFVEMRELQLAGDKEGANEIRAELGLGQGRMKNGSNKGQGRNNGKRQRSETRGQNQGGSFIDANGDGVCDNL